LENPATLSDEAYRRRYVERFQAWHETYPLTPDARLWKQPA
jgi:hypothetical protein